MFEFIMIMLAWFAVAFGVSILVGQAIKYGGATQDIIPPTQPEDPVLRDPGADHPPWCKCRQYHN